MNIGYVRVSTIEQNEARQVEGLEQYKIDKWFKEKVSAKDTNRPKLIQMLDFAREGDTVFVWDFSRLSRSVKDLLEITEQLQLKGIHLRSIKESLDTTTPGGKLMLVMIGAINQFERENLLERQREGIAIAKRNGAYKGRKQIKRPLNWEEIYPRWKNREISGAEAMKLLKLKRNTFYKFVNEEKEA